jgi:DNA-binding CsgD family transcriptional regulator
LGGVGVELEKILDHNDSILLLELIYLSTSCNTEDQYKEIVQNLKNLIHFDLASSGIGSLTDDNTLKHNIINVDYPEEWLDVYTQEGHIHTDPIIIENFTQFDLQYWADTYKKYSPDKEFIKQAEDFDLKTGYSCGTRNRRRTDGSIFTIAGRNIERDIRTETVITHVVPHLHNCMVRILVGKHRRNIKLTEREKEILKWFKDGKSVWDVSSLLNISENTVKFHSKNIFEKLDVVNRTQAVATAISEELI